MVGACNKGFFVRGLARLTLIILMGLGCVAYAAADTIDFEDVPVGGYLEFTSHGFRFSVGQGISVFVGGNSSNHYLAVLPLDAVNVRQESLLPFNVVQFDAAAPNAGGPAPVIIGGTVFVLQPGFQTFNAGFTNRLNVTFIPLSNVSYFVDNIVVSVPEPVSFLFLVIGLISLVAVGTRIRLRYALSKN